MVLHFGEDLANAVVGSVITATGLAWIVFRVRVAQVYSTCLVRMADSEYGTHRCPALSLDASVPPA